MDYSPSYLGMSAKLATTQLPNVPLARFSGMSRSGQSSLVELYNETFDETRIGESSNYRIFELAGVDCTLNKKNLYKVSET